MKLLTKDLRTDSLKGTQWIGVVEDNADDLLEGRCKVRVLGKMDQRVDPGDPTSEFVIPTVSLPWARPSVASSGGSQSGSGTFSVPKIGTILRVTFDNGNYYSPVYHESVYPSDELKAEIENSYSNSHVLIYDTAFGLTSDSGSITNERPGEAIKVFFTEEKGFMIDYSTSVGPSTINIKPDNSIEIRNPNGDSIVMLNDGNVTFTHSAKFIVNSTNNTEINCKDLIVNCNTADVKASNKAIIDSPKIELGRGATESIIKGDLFAEIFDNHIHPTPVGPSGIPLISMKPTLSKVSSTK